MTASFTYPTMAQLMVSMAKTEFKPFTNADWDVFAGCETENPLIGFDGEFCLVIDGNNVNIIHPDDEFGGQLFELTQTA
jgi:hypothetical protein